MGVSLGVFTISLALICNRRVAAQKKIAERPGLYVDVTICKG